MSGTPLCTSLRKIWRRPRKQKAQRAPALDEIVLPSHVAYDGRYVVAKQGIAGVLKTDGRSFARSFRTKPPARILSTDGFATVSPDYLGEIVRQ